MSIKSTLGDDQLSLSGLTIGIAGLGLMGGSLGLGLASSCARRIGMDQDPRVGDAALSRNAVDEMVIGLPELAKRSDILVLAAPVRGILAMLRDLSTLAVPAGSSRVVLDIGSTKQEVVDAMADLGPGWDPIGAHPICGREVSGVESADGTMFQSAAFMLCPLPRTTPRALEVARSLALAVGATPRVMDAVEHDTLIAMTSHLPYLAALALALTAGKTSSAAFLAGSGFRDTSRLAGSNIKMMMDILVTNRQPVLQTLDEYMARLGELRARLAADDERLLQELLEQGRRIRARMLLDGEQATQEDEK
jgi:prephenate dehydrogenase